ncbi:TadE/TadG family type IV pilus assembly protein [Sphingobium sp. AN558]|uniref:pilus assembly protein TadG-related protein n=1 Tax=Sphingobium sp. AN558 TaxID=3133442 RepID=UPI0030C0C23F
MGKSSGPWKGFLTRLRSNQAGNTLAIVAAAIIPLLGLVGGGIDMSRIYLTKARMQQACDAGALAGRKQMGSGAWTANSSKANIVALQLFDANFTDGAYGTGSRTRSYSESNGKVTGTASVPVPMTIMKVFGQTSKTINVTCDAEMRLPNTDVMFVLDNTGSMGETNVGDTDTKINGLKKAVKCFYEALMKVDTSADCGSTPSGTNGSTVQLRFGFVPYSVNVNVGKLLNNDWIANNWTYQSRYFTGSAGAWGNWQSIAASWGSCPADTATTQYRNRTNGNIFGFAYCSAGDYRTVSGGSTQYTYDARSWDISGLKAGGSSWNDSVSLPVGSGGANISVDWDGCVEERQTVRASSYDPIPANAYDLNIDMVPNVSDPTTQWGPMLPGAVWGRVNNGGQNNYSSVTTSNDLDHNNDYYCPAPAKKLQTYPTASPFETYVNSLVPTGNTYHDIGLIWGARLLSPTGIFASENAFTPNGGTIERHLIFMTDGDTVTDNDNYTAYGVPWWDRRTTAASASPTNTQLTDQVNMRFLAMCKAIKNKNITLWVISFGSGVSTTAQTNLQNCASTGRYYTASNSAQLINQFKAIADEISQLRLTN